MKKTLIALVLFANSCSFPDTPGREISDPRKYFGCYELPNNEIIQLTKDKLLFEKRSAVFKISYREDKFGNFILASPALYFEGNGSFDFFKSSGEGTYIRFPERDSNLEIRIPDRSGGYTPAWRAACRRKKN